MNAEQIQLVAAVVTFAAAGFIAGIATSALMVSTHTPEGIPVAWVVDLARTLRLLILVGGVTMATAALILISIEFLDREDSAAETA